MLFCPFKSCWLPRFASKYRKEPLNQLFRDFCKFYKKKYGEDHTGCLIDKTVCNKYPKYPGCNCEDCPMRDEGFVPPSGPEDAKILFIGRPNVGKSTLINRLLKKRSAISYETPGLTRDINEYLINH